MWHILVKNLRIYQCPQVRTYQYLNIRIQIAHLAFQINFFNVFHTKEFKLNILTAIFSGATKRRRKHKMLQIWNQRVMKKNYLYRCYYIHLKDSFLFMLAGYDRTITGAQPGIFRGMKGSLEWGHFDNCFMCGTQKKGPAGKTFGVFSPRCS